MPLFQQSVQKKFIKDLDKTKLDSAYQKLITHFGNTEVQENISKAKEEQYQEGFLRALFVDVLGYVLNPQPNYNLITEQKNEKNSRKADGAVLKDGKPIAVIELKSVKTADLQSIEIQAFNYKNNQAECVYVVTSNFQKLRFYIENAVDFEEFDLFDLSKERFDLLYLCLHVDNVLSNVPLRIKQASLEKEENITKKLYADYSLFKQALFKDLSIQNSDLSKLALFKKTQKLLDRFLFIFFAEDKGLLPPNSVSEILNQWDKLKELDAYQPLYNRFKLYFGYLNKGHKGKYYDIFAYNGGLFAPDELLDNLLITDNILYNHCRALSHYDFETEVDTNILGHIFEHSLNEVDEVAAHTEGVSLDKGKTKRKKDGIFYTPRYITKYIVESTVGELCKQKKITLGLDNEALIKADTKKDRKLYQAKIDEYRNWLLHLTILDPACGSGAFLNQAFEFLLQEHRLIDSMTAMLFGDSLIMTDNVTEILENNIFGVDINEESVEIARLSLWLRTAKVGRKLNDLSRNIKCGNSLISDPTVAGDLAFDWKKAFPQVFEKGGFDVVIGNPPYVQSHSILEKEKAFFYSNYVTAEYQINTYALFIEKIFSLLKQEGLYAYIVPNYFLSTQNDRKLRNLIFIKNHALEVLNTFNVFESATVDTLILVGTNSNVSPKSTAIRSVSSNCKSILERLEKIGNKVFSFDESRLLETSQEEDVILSFDEQFSLKGENRLSDFFDFYKGMQPYEQGKGKPAQTREMMNDKVYHATYKIDESYLPLLTASSIKRYLTVWEGTWIKYGVNLAAPRKKEIFEGERLLLNRIVSKDRLDITYEFETKINNTDVFNLKPKKDIVIPFSIKALLAIIATKLCALYFKKQNINLNRDAFPKINVNTLESFPVPHISDKLLEELKILSNNMLDSHLEKQKQNSRFIKLLQSSFSNLTVNKKIETWYDMTFGEFRKELEKQKIAIPIKELMDYQDLFDTNATQLKELQTKITHTEKAIDKLVYALYDLTSEEIQIIENS